MSAAKPKIYVFVSGQAAWGDLFGAAIAEDGEVLAGHCSSSIWFVKRDMGLTPYCDWQHEHYAAHYPDGYELVDLTETTRDQLDAHEGFQAALQRNATSAASADSPSKEPTNAA